MTLKYAVFLKQSICTFSQRHSCYLLQLGCNIIRQWSAKDCSHFCYYSKKKVLMSYVLNSLQVCLVIFKLIIKKSISQPSLKPSSMFNLQNEPLKIKFIWVSHVTLHFADTFIILSLIMTSCFEAKVHREVFWLEIPIPKFFFLGKLPTVKCVNLPKGSFLPEMSWLMHHMWVSRAQH